MNLKQIEKNGVTIAVVYSREPLIRDGQSALDLLATIKYETGCNRFALEKSAIAEDFFQLRTGVAGAVLQKFINYQAIAAVFGDFSGYPSKPFQDLMFESNQGRNFFFAATEAEAVEKLCHA